MEYRALGGAKLGPGFVASVSEAGNEADKGKRTAVKKGIDTPVTYERTMHLRIRRTSVGTVLTNPGVGATKSWSM